jgi:hypothetical protein
MRSARGRASSGGWMSNLDFVIVLISLSAARISHVPVSTPGKGRCLLSHVCSACSGEILLGKKHESQLTVTTGIFTTIKDPLRKNTYLDARFSFIVCRNLASFF